MPTAIARALFVLSLMAAPSHAASLYPDGRGPPRGDVHRVEATCAANCRQQHNQCRIATRGASRCDTQLQRCLQGCLGKKKGR